ncbi:MAG TPA: DUF5123 domain-containing protein [Paludibacteraceae bacterium]|nr:DUF5123 domain-containing protein [Paludibacteraceae bacterium]HPT43026.1 DUF5123 domain-containing protein [Paludibacteraceae bacterium]
MKRNKNIFAAIVVILLMVSGTFSACTEDEPELQLPYLFRPINFQVELNKTIATITWSPVDSAVSYTLQLSNDSLDYSSPILDITTTKLSVVKELAGDTKFYARIRANSGIESKSSKFNTTLSFKTPKENLFQGYGTGNNTGVLYSAYMTATKTLTVKWLPGANTTHLILTADGGLKDSVLISASEAAAGSKIVSLPANALWKTRIYNGKILRGTTYGLTEGDIYLSAGEDLLSAMTNATSGQVILLAGGATFPIGGSAYNFNKNLKIRSASPVNRAVICMTSGTPTSTANMFGVEASAAIDSLVFENIDFTGYCDNNPAATKIGYLFNNKTAYAIASLKFINCNIHNIGNTPMRMSGNTEQRISDLKFKGCVINDVGFSSTYAIVNSNSKDYFDNITFEYCTVYNFKGSLILRTGAYTMGTVSLTNCTFNQATQDAGSTRLLVDLNNMTVTGGLTIKNCIFGSNGTIAAGVRTTGTKTISGTYFTTDYLDETLVGGATYTIKDKLTSFNGASTDLWNNPVNGDFTLKTTSFAGKGISGDLRWY